MTASSKTKWTAQELGRACVCLALRKAARHIARRYDEAFRPISLTSGQFSILASLLQDRAVPLGALASALGMDRTTLNRNLKPLEAQGLVETSADRSDARIRALHLTAKGRQTIARALPLWQEAQSESTARLGPTPWPEFREQLKALG